MSRKMKSKFKITIIVVLVALTVAASVTFVFFNKIKFSKAQHLTSSKVIKMPNLEGTTNGFTCTGICFDEKEQVFYIGNAGKNLPEDSDFKASIVKVSADFSNVIDVIPCFETFPKMRDIQGVAVDMKTNTLWFCSYGENVVRNITKQGKLLSEIKVEKPSGIAYDDRTDSLWVLTNNRLLHITKQGKILNSISVYERGQDQLFLDKKNNFMYFTAGTNYKSSNYLFRINLDDGDVKPLYVLDDSYAVEGVSINESGIMILNDGYYHSAKVPVNQVNIYTFEKDCKE